MKPPNLIDSEHNLANDYIFVYFFSRWVQVPLQRRAVMYHVIRVLCDVMC
jgi:hypothetical protein